MNLNNLIEYYELPDSSLIIEYFYKEEKLENPMDFFKQFPEIFQNEFPSQSEFKTEYDKSKIFKNTHKLLISENGFNLVLL